MFFRPAEKIKILKEKRSNKILPKSILKSMVFIIVSDPDSNLIRIQSGQWIRIQEGKKDPQK
jgi:hypothetical protein